MVAELPCQPHVQVIVCTRRRRSPARAAGTEARRPSTAVGPSGRRISSRSAARSASVRAVVEHLRPGSCDPGRSMSGSLSRVDLPATPPFVLRGRLLTPLGAGGTRHEPDALLGVDAGGRITFAGHASQRPELADESIDLRPWVLMPGMVDL